MLHEHRVAEEDVADKTVQRVFLDAGLEPHRHYKLNIAKGPKVTVDYFIEKRRPLALEIIRARNDLTGTMQKWGYRWQELRKTYRGLAPVMLYDRNTQVIDTYEREVGERECELFCGYDETDRIHELLERVQ